MKILICGYGNIGTHVHKEFESKNNIIHIYDKYKSEYNKLFDEVYDAAFICVPTEMNEDGSADVTEVFNASEMLKDKAKVIIIKSAIPVGTCAKIGLNNVVISPEYYGTTQHSLESPNFAVLGGQQEAIQDAAAAYQTVKDGSFRFIFTSWETAELAKYMENCWLAAKVTFCNEFAAIAKAYGIPYPQLRECFVADERVNPSHTFVYENKPYYDSHCLNKDIPALIHFCQQDGINTPLMSSVDEINKAKKEAINNGNFTL